MAVILIIFNFNLRTWNLRPAVATIFMWTVARHCLKASASVLWRALLRHCSSSAPRLLSSAAAATYQITIIHNTLSAIASATGGSRLSSMSEAIGAPASVSEITIPSAGADPSISPHWLRHYLQSKRRARSWQRPKKSWKKRLCCRCDFVFYAVT